MVHAPERASGRFFDSLRWNFLLMGGMGILGLVLLGVLAGNLGYRALMEAERLHLEETGNMAANSIELLLNSTGLSTVDPARLQSIVTKLKKETRFRFTLIRQDGVVLADSDADPRYMENHAQRPEVALARAGITDFELRYSHTLGMDTLYFARPWQGIILRAAMPLHFIVPLLASLLAVVLTVCTVSVAAMLLVSWRMYRRINVPIQHILGAARSWEQGQEPPPLYLRRPTELARIAMALKSMAEKLKSQIEAAHIRERELEYLFGAIREAVLVVDQNQIIYRYNDSARDFIATLEGSTRFSSSRQSDEEDLDRLTGMHLLTFIRSSELAAAVSECRQTEKPLTTSVALYGSAIGTLNVYVAPLALPEQHGNTLFILVLYIGT